ncbi:MAG: URC4/urg3 family protein [Alphaproteobacteria bacterium]|nr:URC4/urg3 family protein [Alphaproteobacteria bacterium]MDP6517616.1 URC4/urg3 family protein [Alphaproteobacteria bacterium]
MTAPDDLDDPRRAVAWLRTPAAVRSRCGAILTAAEHDRLRHFAFEPAQVAPAAQYVVDTITAAYPDIEVPFHSRWRHFSVGEVDRWGRLATALDGEPVDAIARSRIDLAVTSVLLDAGAGEQWRYRDDETGQVHGRSEGLAIASLNLFANGALSAKAGAPLRADGAALAAIERPALAAAFQVTGDNPLIGMSGRVDLLRRLGQALGRRPDIFGAENPRVGNLLDHLLGRARDGRLAAPVILETVIAGLESVWPARIDIGGVNLGDVGRHPVVATGDLTDRLVPFHKLSQWLAYSLVEPLEAFGLVVTDLDGLTGLAEYRNGGLLVDTGVLVAKHRAVTEQTHAADSEVVVEWRALTVALLDRLAEQVRARLGLDAAALPLVKVLEGGTWSAGRQIARSLRPDGAPPIRIVSDGTVF